MHEVLVNRLGGLSLPRKSVVRLTDRPAMTLDVYRGRKTTTQQQQQCSSGSGLIQRCQTRSWVVPYTVNVELQWLEHLLDYENIFETGVVRDDEC